MVAFYTIIMPHMHLLVFKTFSQLSLSKVEREESIELSSTPVQHPINETNIDTSYFSEEDDDPYRDFWRDAETQVKHSSTFRSLEQYSQTLTSTLHHLKESSEKLKELQRDMDHRWEQIQFAWLNRLESKVYDASATENTTIPFVMLRETLEKLVQSYYNQSRGDLNMGELQASWNKTWDIFSLFIQSQTKELHSDTWSHEQEQILPITMENLEDQESKNNTTDYVSMDHVWDAVLQIRDAFYERIAHRFSVIGYENQKTFDRLRNQKVNENISKDEFVSQKDWESITKTVQSHLDGVLESMIRDHEPSIMMDKLQDDEEINRTVHSILEYTNDTYTRWKRVHDIRVKKQKHYTSLYLNENSSQVDMYCCDRGEVDQMLDDVFLYLFQSKDIRGALADSLNKMKADRGLSELDTAEITSLAPLTGISERSFPSSRQKFWMETLNIPLWPELGRALDQAVRRVYGLNKYMDAAVNYLAGNDHGVKPFSHSLGNMLTSRFGKMEVPEQFDKMIMKSGILFRGGVI
jgi:hypothetical protein